MAAPLTGLSARLKAVLADGEWHSFLELYAAGRTAISPEAATRRLLYYRDRNRALRRAKGQPPGLGRAPLSPEEAVEAGRRQKVYHTVKTMGAEQRGGRFGGEIFFRLPDGTPRWRSVVRKARARAAAREERATA